MAATQVGTSATPGSSNIGPATPSDITKQTGDTVLLVVANKPATTTPDAITDWTQDLTVSLGSGTQGNDTGPVRLTIYRREVPGGGFTIPGATQANATGAVITASAVCYRPGAGETLSFTYASGSDTVADTSWSVTGNTTLGYTTGDLLYLLSALGTDANSFGTASVTATGATFGALTEHNDTANANGSDVRHVTHSCSVSSGTASAAPVFACTLSSGTNSVGGTVFVRINSAAAPAAPPLLRPSRRLNIGALLDL